MSNDQDKRNLPCNDNDDEGRTKEEMYAPSFVAHQIEEICAYFDKHGYVVVDDILTKSEIEASVGEIWHMLETKEKKTNDEKPVQRTDPKSWSNQAWPEYICRRGGFVGKFPFWKRMKTLDGIYCQEQPQAWKNRQHPVIYEIMTHIMKTQKLWMSVDRYGVLRPSRKKVLEDTSTKNEEHKSDKCVEDESKDKEEDWSSASNWIHWDLSPFHFGTSAAGFAINEDVSYETLQKDFGSVRTQALINLTDNITERGGFHCVPGFHGSRFFDWGKENLAKFTKDGKSPTRNFIDVPVDDPMRSEVKKVPMQAGSLLIWNSQLPHGNFPNQSDQFRLVQYLKHIPVDDPREFLPVIPNSDFPTSAWFPPNFQPSKLGACLFGLSPYDDDMTGNQNNENSD